MGADRGLGRRLAAGRAHAAGATRRRPHRPAPAGLLHRRGAARPRRRPTRAPRARRPARTPARAPSATRRCRSPARPRCSPHWTAPTCSWSHWTPTAPGTAATACCARCCCASGRPRTNARCSAARPPGSPSTTSSTPPSRISCAPPRSATRPRCWRRREPWFFERGAAAAFLDARRAAPRRGRGAAAGALARLRRHHRRAARPGAALARPGYHGDRPAHRRRRVARPPRRGTGDARGHRHVRVGVRARGRPDAPGGRAGGCGRRRAPDRPHGARQRAHPRRAVRRGRGDPGGLVAGAGARRLVVQRDPADGRLVRAQPARAGPHRPARRPPPRGGPASPTTSNAGGATPPPVVALLRLVQARRRYLDGAVAEARTLHVRATTLAEAAARPRLLVLALVFLADAELGVGDRPPPVRRSVGPARSSPTSRSPPSRRAASRTPSSASAGPRRARPTARARSSRS